MRDAKGKSATRRLPGAATLREERGAVVIIVAAMIAALVGVLALVVDVGMLYQQRRQLQTAVDSAALAAAMEVAEGRGETAAQTVGASYVAQNKGTTAPVSTTVSFPSGTQVRVAATVDRDLWFARVFGRTSQGIGAQATANFGVATTVRDLMPIIVPEQSIADHVGSDNPATFEFGEDRPVEPFTKTATLDGSTITYRITLINTYGRTVDVAIRDPLASNLTYVEGSADHGGAYTPGDRTVRWTLGGIPDGDSRTVTFRATTSNGQTANTAYADVSGEKKEISASASEETAQRGYFWLCDFDGGSNDVPTYDNWIRYGYPEEVAIGMVVNGSGMKTALRDAVEWRTANDPKVLLPLFDYTEGSGHAGAYHVVGFAEFVITGSNFHGSNKSLTGYFTTGTVAVGSSDYGEEPPPDHGVRTIWLSE